MSAAPTSSRPTRTQLIALLLTLLVLAGVAALVLLTRPSDRSSDADIGVRTLETVEVAISTDGTVEQARRYLRIEGPDGEVTTDDEAVGEEDLPIVARVRYEVDGREVGPGDVGDRSGPAVVGVELRNVSAETRSISYGTPDGMVEEDVEIAVPLFADVVLSLGEEWTEVTAPDAVVTADPGGGTQVRWQAALFDPIGEATSSLTLEATVDGGSLPHLTIDALPVTTTSSQLVGVADDLLTQRATLDALAAVSADALRSGVSQAADGADELVGGIDALQAGIADALGEFDELDPDALIADALQGLGGQLDTDAVLDDLLTEAMADLPDAEQLAAQLDPATLLADAGFDDLFDQLLADALPDADEFPELDPADLEIDAGAVLADLDLDQALGEALSDIDVGALLAEQLGDVDVAQLLADELADLDLAALLEDALSDVDPADLLGQLDLDGSLGDLLAELAADAADELAELFSPEQLQATLEDAVGDRSLGEIVGDAQLEPLLATLLSTDDLELDLAAVLTVLLDEVGLPVPPIGEPQLDELVRLVGAKITLVDGLLAELTAIEDRLNEVLPDEPDPEDTTTATAELATTLAERLRDVAAALGSPDLTLFDDLDAALATTSERIGGAAEALDAAEAELADDRPELLVPVRDEIEAAAQSSDSADARAAAAREAVTDRSDELAASIRSVADELEALGAGLDPDGSAPDGALPPLDDDLASLREGLTALRVGLEGFDGPIAELRDGLEETHDIGEVLRQSLADATIDLSPAVAELQGRVAARLDDIALSDLPLAELFDALDLEIDVGPLLTELLAELDLSDLTELLDGLDVDLTQVIDALELDLEALIDPLVDELPDLAELLEEVDPAPLLDVVDLEQVFPPDVLDELLADLAPEPQQLATLLGAALEDLSPPDAAELLDQIDLDLAELLEAAELTPEALLGSPELPPEDELLAALDIDPDVLAGELGLDTLADLDDVTEGLLEGISELGQGATALTEGLELIAGEGLPELVRQLDEENRDAQRDLAVLRELDARATDAGSATTPNDVAANVRYRLVSEPEGTGSWPLLVGGLVVALAIWAAVRAARSSRADGLNRQ